MGKKNQPRVAIIMGSQSDHPSMKDAEEALKLMGVSFQVQIISAHRTPKEMVSFAEGAAKKGFQVIIAGAGGAAHLPGMVASLTVLPVIGVPVSHGPLEGHDALLSIVQMPKGVPVATVAIDNSFNAGLLASRIIGISDSSVAKKVAAYREKIRKKVRAQKL